MELPRRRKALPKGPWLAWMICGALAANSLIRDSRAADPSWLWPADQSSLPAAVSLALDRMTSAIPPETSGLTLHPSLSGMLAIAADPSCSMSLRLSAISSEAVSGQEPFYPSLWSSAVGTLLERTSSPSTTAREITVFLADVSLQGDVPPGEAGESDAAELAKKLSNPVANLISVPFQYNADFNAGTSGHAHRSYLNIQPVIPFKLNDDLSLITRTIIPITYQEELAPGQGTNFGLGDTSMSFFFAPKEHPGGWILGAGPVFLLPTSTDTALGGGKWGAGPTVLALRQEHGWTYGILASHTWSFAGDGDRSAVNATFLQPFLSYQFSTATTLGINLESTYDWTRRQWTVPANLSVSQVVKLGRLPVSFSLGGRYYAEGPSGGPDWGMRFAMTFVFPE